MDSHNKTSKSCKKPLASKPLLDQLRECRRYMHYSLRTEQAYVHWVKAFVRWHGLRHPRDMGAADVERFLTHLASERRVFSATHRQAFSALLFLCREVLDLDLPWENEFTRPAIREADPRRARGQRGAAAARRDGERGRGGTSRPVALRHGHAVDGGLASAREGSLLRARRHGRTRGQGGEGRRGHTAARWPRSCDSNWRIRGDSGQWIACRDFLAWKYPTPSR